MADSRKRSFSGLYDEELNKHDEDRNLIEPDTKKPRFNTSWLDADWSDTSSEGEIFDPPKYPTLGKLRSALNDAFDYEILEALSERLSTDGDLAAKVKIMIDGLSSMQDQAKAKKKARTPVAAVDCLEDVDGEVPASRRYMPQSPDLKPSIFSPEIHEMAARAAGYESSMDPVAPLRSPVYMPLSPNLDPNLPWSSLSQVGYEITACPEDTDPCFGLCARNSPKAEPEDESEGELQENPDSLEQESEMSESVFSQEIHEMAARAGHKPWRTTLRYPTFVYPNTGRTGFAPSSPPAPGSRKRRTPDEPSDRRLNNKRARTQPCDSHLSTLTPKLPTPPPHPLGVIGVLPAELRQIVYAHLGLTTRVCRRYITHEGHERYDIDGGYVLPCRHHFNTGEGESKVVYYEKNSSDPQDVDVSSLLNLAATCKTIQGEINPLLYESSVLSIRMPPLEPGLRLSDGVIEACTTNLPWSRCNCVTLAFEGKVTADDEYSGMKPFALLDHAKTILDYLCSKMVRLGTLTIVLPEIEEEDKYDYSTVLEKRMVEARVKEAAKKLVEKCNVSRVLVGGLDMPFKGVLDTRLVGRKREDLEKIFEVALRKWAAMGEGDRSDVCDYTGEHLAL